MDIENHLRLKMVLFAGRASTAAWKRRKSPSPGSQLTMDRNDIFEFFYNWGWLIIIIGLYLVIGLTYR